MIEAQRLGVVLHPRKGHAKFNAGMVRDGDTVHMLYRWAKGKFDNTGKIAGYHQDFISYARLNTRGEVLYDADSKGFITPQSLGNPDLLVEDPRIVSFEGEYILFYTVWDGQVARVGMSRTLDFQTVEHIGVIPSLDWDKDAFILPERIDGKIVYIHRIEPDIQIDYFDSFEDMLDEAYWADYRGRAHEQVVIASRFDWECKKVGGSIPPIKTEQGWLFIYHGVSDDREPFCYRVGAALLDLRNPSRVIARLPYPILEPAEDYERFGDVNEVVFPQGAYIDGDFLYMSYGGADTVVAMCRYPLDELLEELKKNTVKEEPLTA